MFCNSSTEQETIYASDLSIEVYMHNLSSLDIENIIKYKIFSMLIRLGIQVRNVSVYEDTKMKVLVALHYCMLFHFGEEDGSIM